MDFKHLYTPIRTKTTFEEPYCIQFSSIEIEKSYLVYKYIL